MAKQSFNFGRPYENGEIEYAPLMLVINGVNTWTNIAKLYMDKGYYPVQHSKVPEKEGFFYTPKWEIENEKCVQKWEEHQVPADETEEYAKAAKIIFGEAV